MRGAHRLHRILLVIVRIIPADAGSTDTTLFIETVTQDHPRGFGEHPIPQQINETGQGSSPRMRGAPVGLGDLAPIVGIIPADAGSTVDMTILVRPMADHPRGCGEHSRGVELVRNPAGSSPRMRGAPLRAGRGRRQQRIIPADAGSTGRIRMKSSRREDHPRGCGEHGHSTLVGLIHKGSSPRMRGARESCKDRP